jgi:hypothetical protein
MPAISTIYTKTRPTKTCWAARRAAFNSESVPHVTGLYAAVLSFFHCGGQSIDRLVPSAACSAQPSHYFVAAGTELEELESDRRNNTNCHRCSSVKRFLNAGIGRCPSLIL